MAGQVKNDPAVKEIEMQDLSHIDKAVDTAGAADDANKSAVAPEAAEGAIPAPTEDEIAASNKELEAKISGKEADDFSPEIKKLIAEKGGSAGEGRAFAIKVLKNMGLSDKYIEKILQNSSKDKAQTEKAAAQPENAAEQADKDEAKAGKSAESSNPEAEKAKTEADKNKPKLGKTTENSGPVNRSDLLKRILVDKYKNSKNDDKAGEKEEKKKKSKLDTAKSIGEKLTAISGMYDNKEDIGKNIEKISDKLMNPGGNTNGSGAQTEKPAANKETKQENSPTSGMAASLLGKLPGMAGTGGASPVNNTAGTNDNTKKEEEKPLPIKEMAQGVAGGYNGTVGTISSLFALRKTKSRVSRSRHRTQAAQNIFKGVGSLSSGTSALLSSGKVGTSEDIKIAGGALSAASGGLNMLSALTGIIGGKHQRSTAKKIADNAENFTQDNSKFNFRIDPSETVRKLRKKKQEYLEPSEAKKEKMDKLGMEPGEYYDNLMSIAKKNRSTYKANKLSMAIAAKFNRQKSEESTKGIGDVISGAADMATGIFSATGIAGNSIVKSFVSPFVKAGAKAAKKFIDNRDKQKAADEKKLNDNLKLETVKEYLEGKRAKIKAQAKAVSNASSLSDEEKNVLSGEITDAEADKIALARLGVNVSDVSGDKPASDAEIHDGFEKIIMKRANNILSAQNKDELLDALMLPHDASAEDVATVLKGE